MSYTKGERYITCSDEWWFTEITNPNFTEPNTVTGRFRYKADALLDAAAPEMYEVLKDARITLNILQPNGSAILRQIDKALGKVEGK